MFSNSNNFKTCQSRKSQSLTALNRWLKGELEDDSIADFAFDCSDEQLGLKNMIPIVAYLKQKEIID